MRNTIRWAGLFFTSVDACMTFGFGMFAAGIFLFKPVLAFALGGVSFALALLPALAVIFWTRYNQRVFPVILGALAAVGFWFNLVSNTGFTAALFQTEIITAANTNQTASDARQRVDRLRARDKELTKKISFWPQNELGPLLAPEAYNEPIKTQKFAVNLEGSKGGCRDKCLLEKEKLARLSQAQELSRERNKLIQTRKQVRKELSNAEKFSLNNKTAVSAAASQADFVSRYMTLDLKPGQTVKDWTTMGTALAISLMISILGWVFNAAAQLMPIEPNSAVRARADGHEHHGPRYLSAGPEHQPQPLQAETLPPGSTTSTSVTMNYSGAGKPPSVDRLMEMIEQFENKSKTA